MRNDQFQSESRETPLAWWTLFILAFVNVLNYFDRSIISLLMQSIKLDLGLTDSQLGVVSGIAMGVFYGLLGVPIAWLSDHYSRKRLLLACIAVWSAATSLCGVAMTGTQLFFARVLVGAGEAGGVPTVHSIVGDLFSARNRSMALSIVTAGSIVGTALGNLFAGQMNQHFGWRLTFIWAGVPGIALVGVMYFMLNEPARGNKDQHGDLSNYKLISGVVRLMSIRSFRFLALGIAAWFFVNSAYSAWLPAFFIRSHNMKSGELGIWFMATAGAGGLTSLILGGWLGGYLRQHKVPPRRMLHISLFFIIAAAPFRYFIVSIADAYLALGMIFMPALLDLIWVGPCYAYIQELVGPKYRSLASAITGLLASIIGVAFGPLTIGVLSDWLKEDLGSESLRIALTISLVVYTAIIVLFMLSARSSDTDLAESAQPVASQA